VSAPRAQSLRAGTLRHRVGTRPAGPAVAARTVATGTVATGTVATAASVTVSTTTSATVVTVTPVASIATAFALRGELGRHKRLVTTSTDDLEELGLLAGGLRSQHPHNFDPVHEKLGVGPQHLAHLGACGEERAVELALRLAGACGPPGPRTVGAAAREFDL
jgi:hypothetical protein